MEHDGLLQGADGELVERLMALLAAESDVWPTRWYDLTVMVSNWIGGPLPDPGMHPDDVDEEALSEAVQNRFDDLIEMDVSEPFLVKAVLHELDAFVDRHEDVGEWQDEGERFRDSMLRMAEDADRRARYRQNLERLDPDRWENLSDEEFVDELFRSAEEHPLTKEVTAGEAAARWARADGWQQDRDVYLSDAVLDSWLAGNIYKNWRGSRG